MVNKENIPPINAAQANKSTRTNMFPTETQQGKWIIKTSK
jgi:hypothetical protein